MPRKLETSDIFALSRCLKQMGVKDHFKKLAQEADKAEDIWTRGFDLVWDLFDIATETKGEGLLLAFLAGPLQTTAEELAHLPLDQLFEQLQQLAAENNLPAFFKSAARLMK